MTVLEQGLKFDVAISQGKEYKSETGISPCLTARSHRATYESESEVGS